MINLATKITVLFSPRFLLKLLLIILMPACCIASSEVSSEPENVYIIETSARPNTLKAHINRKNRYTPTQFILYGLEVHIAKQVQNVMCDGRPVREIRPGRWQIPRGCYHISWEIPLFDARTTQAVRRQTVKSENSILIAEAASLPYLQNVPGQKIQVNIPQLKAIFPTPNDEHAILIPAKIPDPFFVVLNPIISSKNVASMKLTYLLDRPEAISKLPALSSYAKGLQWLKENIFTHNSGQQNFTVAWLGLAKNQPNYNGSTGTNVLLLNYPIRKGVSFSKEMLLYVVLHESFHQLSNDIPEPPGWIAESLASYYGARALQAALPNNPKTERIVERFHQDGKQYSNGLLTIDRMVIRGERSQYGAFYTKGFTFWVRVNNELKKTRNDSLDHYVIKILQMRPNDNQSKKLQQILNLPPQTWARLDREFLR